MGVICGSRDGKTIFGVSVELSANPGLFYPDGVYSR